LLDSFYLAWAENRPLSESALRLRDWLLETGKREVAGVAEGIQAG